MITQKEYLKLQKEKSPNSPIVKNVCFAFLVGGIICTIGQGIMQLYKSYGLGMLDASNATTITMIFIGALLTGFKLYEKIAKFAGAGTIVPITGFANSIVAPAMEFKTEGIILGLCGKMFVIAGPVLVFGITSSVLYGIIVMLSK